MQISISDNIHDTIFVLSIAYLMILAYRNGTYFCFLSVVQRILSRFILKISIYFLKFFSFYLQALICSLIFFFKIAGSQSISSLAITLLTLPVLVVLQTLNVSRLFIQSQVDLNQSSRSYTHFTIVLKIYGEVIVSYSESSTTNLDVFSGIFRPILQLRIFDFLFYPSPY